MRCSKCGSDNPADKKFCGDCGLPLTNSCRKCGAENPPSKRFCGDCGATLAAANAATQPALSNTLDVAISSGQAAVIEGERKTVTALFADIKGSMELIEDLDPEEAREIVDPALKLMIDTVHRYDGYIVQSTGDGIFGLFGAPLAHEDHPQRALYAALRMQEEMRRLADRLRAEKGVNLQIRIGANVGDVVVRPLKTGESEVEYTPIGHSISLAARLQSLASSGSITISDGLRKLVEGYFTLKALGPAHIKGSSEPVNVYEVVGLGLLRTRLERAATRGLTKFVGRQREMDALKHAAKQALTGHGQIVAVMADPGVGKSRLFYEFKATSQSGWIVLQAYSISHGKASSYLPVIELLNDYFRIVAENEPRQRRQKVLGKLLELDRSLEDVLPYLFTLLGLHGGTDPLARMDAQIRRRRTQESLKRIFLRESLQQPLMLVFEDLHWIDADTQAVLDLLADSIVNAHILLLVNYRPEYRHEWGHRTHYTQLRLDPLGDEGAEEMLQALLNSSAPLAIPPGKDGQRSFADSKPGALPESPHTLGQLMRFILDRTQGNPFFIEEMLQVLFDEGVVVRDRTDLTIARPLVQVHIPATVQGVLASRIDRLPHQEKELLQTLAVIGREFSLPLIRRVVQTSEDTLELMLSHLQRTDFISEEPAFPDIEYMFKHALTQDVAYNSLLTERRKQIHEQIAQAMESSYGERLKDHLKELALHYGRSGNALKAIEYLRLAGEQAASHSLLEEAIAQLEAALSLLPKLENAAARDRQELAIRMALITPLNAANPVAAPANQQNLMRARLLCEQLGQLQLLPRILLFQFFIHWSVKNFAIARECMEQLRALSAHGSDEITRFLASFIAGFLAETNGDYVSERDYCERALDLSVGTRIALINNVDIAIGFVNCNSRLKESLWALGYPEQARMQYARMLDLLGGPIGTYAQGIGIVMRLEMSNLMRDNGQMLEQAERLIALAQESGITYFSGIGMTLLGRAIAVEGDADRGIEAVAEGRRTLLGLGELAILDVCEYHAAAAYLGAGRANEGLAIVEGAIAKCAAGGVRSFEADLHRLKGELILAAGVQTTEAEDSFRRAISTAQRQQAKSWELRATLSLARLLIKQGRCDEARTQLAGVYNWFTEGFDTPDLKDARELLDGLSA